MTATYRNLEELYPVLNARRFTAGWHKARPSLWPEPHTPFAALHWRYEEATEYLDRAGDWIGTDLAERRNLLMFNPVGDNDYASLPTLVAAYQMIKPGEAARAHRHSPNALRLILDAEPGAATVVDGVQLPMERGDILLTPGWTWHSHFNETQANAYWIDVLDVPLVHRLESMFFEPHPDEHQPVYTRPATSPWRFTLHDQAQLLAEEPWRATDHRAVTLDTPDMKTMQLRVHEFKVHGRLPDERVVENRVFAVIEGAGEVQVGDTRHRWQRGDVFVVPMWRWHRLEATSHARLLEVSDAPVHHMLGLFRREERVGQS